MSRDETPAIDHFECPYCASEVYQSSKEREVRLHIEQSSDGKHTGREGFAPMTRVRAVDEDGEEIDSRDGAGMKRDPDKYDEICDPDDDLTPDEQRIVAAKMMHLDYSAAEIVAFLEEHGHGVQQQTVSETLRDYFGTTAIARGAPKYEDRNPRQQRAIDAAARWRLSEFETQREAAAHIDEKELYVGHCNNRFDSIVAERMEVLEAESDDESTPETVRRESATGTYHGPSEGIDATMRHISERPTTDASEHSADPDERPVPESTPDDAESNLETAYRELDLLRRLVNEEQLNANAAFDEVKQILERTASV